MLCFLYTIALGAWLAVIGVLVERALPARAPRRWVWCAIIGLNMTIPALFQAKHNVPVPVTDAAARPSWWALIGSYDALLMRLWVITSLLLLLWTLFSVWRVSRVIREARKTRADDVVDGVPVVVTASVGPAAVGVLRSRVLMPKWVLAMPRPQRQYVLRHEDEHRKAHDARLLFFMSLAVVVTPWNLALWYQLRRLSLAVELDCDNRVVDALGNADTYGELLLRVAEATSRGPRLQPGLLGGAGTLERRLVSLLVPAQLSRAARHLLAAAAIGLLLIALSTPHPKLASASHHHAAEGQP